MAQPNLTRPGLTNAGLAAPGATHASASPGSAAVGAGTDAPLRLQHVQVQRIHLQDRPGWQRVTVVLSGTGHADALAALNQFFNASWLTTLDWPLQDALQLQAGEGLSLREEGWALRESACNGADWVRVASSFGDADALLRWDEWHRALQCLRCFLQLMQRYPKGEPRYAADQGFRVRLSV